MNILIFNLGMDKNDAPLAFTIDWVNEFAKHCDRVIVLSLRSGDYAIAENVQVFDIGHQKGYSKPRLLFNFYYYLFFLLWKYKIDGVFSHMNQLFSALAGFVLKLKGIPLVTWYAHASVTTSLKVAHYFSKFMVASVYDAYPYKKGKLRVIGQGIDTGLFMKKVSIHPENLILYSGRISKVKSIDTLIEAFAKIRSSSLILQIVGDAISSEDKRYLEDLRFLVRTLEIQDFVKFEPSKQRSLLPDLNNLCAVYVNMTPSGSGDKVAWEAMACETPTIVANTGMIETLGKYERICLFEYRNANDLADKIVNILHLSEIERNEMGSYLRSQVAKLHSLEALPQKVLSLF